MQAILCVVGQEVQLVAENTQLCARQRSGVTAAVHAIRKLLDSDEQEAVFLVDAKNSLNSLNQAVLLHSIQVLCPSLATCFIKVYKALPNCL